MFTACFIVILLFFGAWIAWGNLSLKTTKYTIKTDKVTSPIKILQLSDFHSCISMYGKLKAVLENEDYDIVVITGDLVRGREREFDLQRKLLSAIRTPKLFVSGNHEESSLEAVKLKTVLLMTGTKILDKCHPYRYSEEIIIHGVNEPGKKDEGLHKRLEEDVKSIKPSEGMFNILLMHRPEGFPSCKGRKLDLVLSGHTHGGQIRLPLAGGLYAPGQGCFPKYDAGIYREDNTAMIVNRGVGGRSFPIRINNRPEVALIEISPK